MRFAGTATQFIVMQATRRLVRRARQAGDKCRTGRPVGVSCNLIKEIEMATAKKPVAKKAAPAKKAPAKKAAPKAATEE